MPENLTLNPWVVSPSGIAPEALDADAVRAVERLVERGHEAYFVGGCVRDILAGRQPKDFDIATAARPQQVKRTFPRNCRIIGRRFKLAHLHFLGGQKILEVSTFRRTPEVDVDSEGGEAGDEADLLITADNEFGTAEQDAVRRDFTINALFLDPIGDRIIDYVGGLQDLHERVIRTIGEPVTRFREDPVRILRAAKFAGRLGFHLDPPTFDAMRTVAPDLRRSAPPRVLEEVLRLLRSGHAFESFQILRDVGALGVILPLVGRYLDQSPSEERILFWRMLEVVDGRVHGGDIPINPVLLGALFLRPVQLAAAERPEVSPTLLAEELLGDLTQTLRLPRRDAGCVKRICGVQSRFRAPESRKFRADQFARDPFFPAALDLFEVAAEATGADRDLVDAWRDRARSGGRGPRPGAEAELADADAEPESEGETGDAPAVADDDEGEGGDHRGRRRRKRRRRRRGRRGGDDAPLAADGGAPREADDQDEPGSTDDEADGPDAGGPHADDQDDDGGEGEGPEMVRTEADVPEPATGGDDAPGRRKRRRRGGRGRRRRGDERGEGAAPPAAPPPVVEPRPEARKQQERAKDHDRGEGRSRGGRGRRRDRRERETEKIDVVEPASYDKSILDQELDPKDVPTFGALVEGSKGARRRRPPRLSVEDELGEPYKPPPHHKDDDGPPPPPPPPPQSDDEFGDW